MKLKERIIIPKIGLNYLYKDKNLSIGRIASLLDCGKTTVQRRLKEHQIPARPSMSIRIPIPRNRLRNLYRAKKQSSNQISKIFACNYATILNRLKEYGIATRDSSDCHIKYPKADFSGDLLEKAYLVGFRLGDLHVRKYEKNGKVISVECASAHWEQINLIRNLFYKYGYVRITKFNNSEIIGVQCALNQSFNFLLPKQDKIEPWILRNNKLFFAFFAGYLDAEGDLGIYSCASLRVGTYDKNILTQIKNKLASQGIFSTLILDRPKGAIIKPAKRLRSSREYRSRCDFWRLAIYRKKSLLRVLEQLELHLRHARLVNKIPVIRDNIYNRNLKFGNLRMK